MRALQENVARVQQEHIRQSTLILKGLIISFFKLHPKIDKIQFTIRGGHQPPCMNICIDDWAVEDCQCQLTTPIEALTGRVKDDLGVVAFGVSTLWEGAVSLWGYRSVIIHRKDYVG